MRSLFRFPDDALPNALAFAHALPWYRLPALHRELYGDRCAQAIPMRRLLAPFHRHRTSRVLADDYGHVDAADPTAFRGVVALSFLTAV